MKILNGIVLLVALVMLSMVAIAGYKRVVDQPADKSEGVVTSMAGSDPLGPSEADPNQQPAGNSQEEWQAQRKRALELNEERSRMAAHAQYKLESFKEGVARVGVNTEALNTYKNKKRAQKQSVAWSEFQNCVRWFSSSVVAFRSTVGMMTQSYIVSVTEGGQRIELGRMTCVEILEMISNYDQRSHCEESQSIFEKSETRLYETYKKCEEIGRRAGLHPDQVQEILRLP